LSQIWIQHQSSENFSLRSIHYSWGLRAASADTAVRLADDAVEVVVDVAKPLGGTHEPPG
jgi:hypothetical protein